jgi:bifunctional UDP-N-acetylglucosamine pyrophosphorylase/glucosamine-1-phosphate N-acetyltransferase/UDP-N-acetylglucosamine pyrophosphorylase
MNSPIAIVLAAGKGTRMKSDLPKVLCQANGRPLIEYVIDALRRSGVEKIIAVIGYQAEKVQQALQGYSDIDFAIQEQQLGTGHAVMVCRDQIADFEGPTLVVAGDSPMIQTNSIERLLQDFRETAPACILGTLHHPDPTGLGRIVRDETGRFVGIVEEKDATPQQKQIDEVNMSTYVFDCQAMLRSLDELTDDNRQREYYITDLPGILLEQGHDVRALPVLQPIEALSVNTVEQLKLVEQHMLGSTSQ